MTTPRFSCSLDGQCYEDTPHGEFPDANACSRRCRAVKHKDLQYAVYQYTPAEARHLAPKDRVEVVKRVTGVRVAPVASYDILVALGAPDFATLGRYPELYDYIVKTYGKDDRLWRALRKSNMPGTIGILEYLLASGYREKILAIGRNLFRVTSLTLPVAQWYFHNFPELRDPSYVVLAFQVHNNSYLTAAGRAPAFGREVFATAVDMIMEEYENEVNPENTVYSHFDDFLDNVIGSLEDIINYYHLPGGEEDDELADLAVAYYQRLVTLGPDSELAVRSFIDLIEYVENNHPYWLDQDTLETAVLGDYNETVSMVRECMSRLLSTDARWALEEFVERNNIQL